MAMTGADALDSHPLLASLGPEPLGNEFDAETLSRDASHLIESCLPVGSTATLP